jgi:Family of unknown function (DUF5758)/Pentapeptide repeats (8 copies)
MTPTEIKKVLQDHAAWLKDPSKGKRANLRSANLRSADLYGADLRSADLDGADLRSADLRSADLPPFSIVPVEGAFVAFKKVVSGVLKVEIPADARRVSSLAGRKCRASKVRVLALVSGTDEDLSSPTHTATALEYPIGATVEADSFDPDIRVECTHGIHFYLTREEAEAH